MHETPALPLHHEPPYRRERLADETISMADASGLIDWFGDDDETPAGPQRTDRRESFRDRAVRMLGPERVAELERRAGDHQPTRARAIGHALLDLLAVLWPSIVFWTALRLAASGWPPVVAWAVSMLVGCGLVLGLKASGRWA